MFDKNKQLEERIKLTEEIKSFAEGKYSVLLELPTGTGKNFNSFSLLQKWEEHEGREFKKILVSVPEIALINNYLEDARKLGFERFIPYMEVICHASLHTKEGKEFDAVILDECHWVISEKRVEAIQNIKTDKLVMLSATIDEEEINIFKKYTNFSRFVLELEEAIDRGILPTPNIILVRRKLDELNQVHEYTDYKKRKMFLSERALYNKISEDISYYYDRHRESPENKYLKNKMLQLGSQRKRILAEFKTNLAKDVISKLPDTEKAIVFCGTVDQATKIGGKGKVCSSRRSKSANGKTIDNFNEGIIKRLFVKDMLREGMNLVDTKYGVETQMGNRRRELLQKLGRVLRHDDPYFYILLSPDTVDDRLISNIPMKYVHAEVNI